ncbi:MAG: tyrosine--tRNA ligase [bacterium]
MMEAKKQLEIIKEGCSELLPEAEFLQKLGRKKQLRVKWGADPSAPDIHLGHMVIIRKLRMFQDLGHKVIFIIGDFTGMIGDPSGKSETRRALSKKEVEKNAKTYKEQVFKILDPRKTEVVYNSKWLSKLTLEDMINLAAKYTVARMLERDDFIKRYTEQKPISIHEFLYPLIQGYDSVMVKADIEVGGTDQKFNLLVGRELQREFNEEPQVIMTMPLLEGLDGVQKMSKSLGNYIGVTDTPSEIFGKTMSIPDTLMMKYYELLSGLNKYELDKIREGLKNNLLHPKDVKRRLAKILVGTFYSKDDADRAEREFESVFKEGGLPENITEITFASKDMENDGSIWLPKAMLIACLCESSSEAVRLLEQGAVEVNGKVIKDKRSKIRIDGVVMIKVGKRRFAKLIRRH